MEKLELTVLMPCLNEEASLAYCIREAKEAIEKYNIAAEILIADNGSTDRSVAVAECEGARVITVEKKGYGSALIAGINAARGHYILMGDSDGSYDFSSLNTYLEKLHEGYALVMGNRFLGGIEKGAMPFSHRYIGVPVLSLLGRICFRVKVGDFHCGIRAFHKETAQRLGLSSMGMEFATELIARFAKSGEKICEIPAVLRRDKRTGRGHLRSIRDGVRHVYYILKETLRK